MILILSGPGQTRVLLSGVDIYGRHSLAKKTVPRIIQPYVIRT